MVGSIPGLVDVLHSLPLCIPPFLVSLCISSLPFSTSPSHSLYLLFGPLGSLGSLGFLYGIFAEKLFHGSLAVGPEKNNNGQRDFPTHRYSDHFLPLLFYSKC